MALSWRRRTSIARSTVSRWVRKLSTASRRVNRPESVVDERNTLPSRRTPSTSARLIRSEASGSASADSLRKVTIEKLGLRSDRESGLSQPLMGVTRQQQLLLERGAERRHAQQDQR